MRMRFAQLYCGKLWWKVGWILLIPSAIIHIPFANSLENTIGILSVILCTVQCIVLIVSAFKMETALKNNFTDDGIRK